MQNVQGKLDTFKKPFRNVVSDNMNYNNVLRLALERGFLLPSCEVYSDAPAGFWDYGPLGAALRNRFVELWRRELVRRDGMLEIDGSQVMSKKVFEASRHLESFVDPIVICVMCGSILRVDRFISEKIGQIVPEGLAEADYDRMLEENGLRCPSCGGGFSSTRKFNMMFRVGIGPAGEEAFLRPETCQSIFVDYPRLFRVMRGKLPFGVAQYGKSFRNEISPRQSLIRLREFYQAEIEVFFNPLRADILPKFSEVEEYRLKLFASGGREMVVACKEAVESRVVPSRLIAYYLAILQQFYEKTGLDMRRCRFRELSERDRAFYAAAAYDFEAETSLGWIELVACNYRTDYDLKRHGELSGVDMSVMDEGEKVIPHIFELSMGVDRSIYCIIEHALGREGERIVLRLKPYLAPMQVSVFPLVSRDGLPEKARIIYSKLKMDWDAYYDESGSIGRRYRRMDEVGTPVNITVDYQSLSDDTVTVRDRDTMRQVRLHVKELQRALSELIRGGSNLFKPT